jgi:enoyl-CoA hydratase/carnithine racemase
MRVGDFVGGARAGPAATIRLDRPPANALSEAVSLALWDAVREVDDEAVRAVVVWGGERIFAAGADVKAMVEFGPREVEPSVGALEGALRHLEALPMPVVAAINGYALGGGCELALACDFRLAASDARIGLPEIRLGIIPGAGGTQRLPRLVGIARARDLIFSGRHVDAEEALDMGLVDGVAAPERVYEEAMARARAFADGPSMAYRAAKIALLAAADRDARAGLEVEREVFRELFATQDQEEGMRAFLEKRTPRFTGR